MEAVEECISGIVEVGQIEADTVKTNYLRFDYGFERMSWVITGFVEKGVGVWGFEVSFHL